MTEYPFHIDARNAAETGSELQIQKRFRGAMKVLAPKVRLVAVPNGGQRSPYAALKAKQEGMSAGFPDLIALAPSGLTAFIEMKARDGTPSDAQLDWMCWMYRSGFPCGVFRGSVSAIRFLRDAGFPVSNFLEGEAA